MELDSLDSCMLHCAMLCYSMLLSLSAEELVQESNQCGQVTQIEMESLLGMTWLFTELGSLIINCTERLEVVFKGDPKFPSALCSKWGQQVRQLGLRGSLQTLN